MRGWLHEDPGVQLFWNYLVNKVDLDISFPSSLLKLCWVRSLGSVYKLQTLGLFCMWTITHSIQLLFSITPNPRSRGRVDFDLFFGEQDCAVRSDLWCARNYHLYQITLSFNYGRMVVVSFSLSTHYWFLIIICRTISVKFDLLWVFARFYQLSTSIKDLSVVI